MKNFDLRICIRIETSLLDREVASIKFPKTKAGLKSMLADLRGERRAIRSGFSPEMVRAHKIRA